MCVCFDCDNDLFPLARSLARFQVSGFYPLDESAEFTKSASIYTSVPPTMVTSTLLKNVAFDLDYQLLAVEQSGSFSNENAQGHRGVLQRNLGLDVIAHEVGGKLGKE